MPTLRTVLSIPVLVALLLTPSAPGATPVVRFSDTVLPLLVSEGGAPAAALLAQDRHGTRRASRYADAGRGIARADHFRAGSITKTFVATVVLQLAAEHRLSLSDTVEQHLPGLLPRLRAGTRHTGEESGRVAPAGPGRAPHLPPTSPPATAPRVDGTRITLRDLLTHTSGIADFAGATRGTVPLTPRQAVRLALALPPGRPGRHAYSSTNYVLLGMVVRQVTGHSYAAEAQRRIIAPLGLTGTSFPGSRRSLPAPHGRAYAADGSDVTELDPRVAGAAGELVTTLDDLDRFYAALLGGALLPPRSLREMLDTRAAHGAYGMGLYPARLPCGLTVWGHNGRIAGSYVRTAATADGRRVLTFRVNTDAKTDPRLERALLAAEFCPRTW
ncbi:serine hydrolase domain-containing protein [Streptomyces sp. NPDC048201]|uniref:serine hydrolase domain-containing protein n=1 Tax=Streptomyces sp. NPDC048201 TaxID=3365513 RepID=UPI00371AAD6A